MELRTARFHAPALFLMLYFIVAPGIAVAAELVVPSARVVKSLNVRATASTTAPVVGKMRPGDVAVLIERSGAWYRVTLSNGSVGYVNAAWVTVEADLRLGGWNLKKLGHGSSKDFAALASIIEDQFDILTVIEVMQKDQKHVGYDTLLKTLGPGWSGVVTDSPRPNTGAGDAEFYAIAYRSTVIRPCADGPALQYFSDNDGGPQGTGENHFVREPAFACFETMTESGGRGWDFILAAYHATWANGDEGLIVEEADHLAQVFAAMQAARPGEADVFMVGDFNLNSDILHEHTAAADRTTGTGSTLNSNGARTTNLYDHLLVLNPKATRELVLDAAVLDVRNRVASEKVFYKTVSDHLPIMGHFVRNRADDD